jgi:hypothetical protein
VQFTCGVADGVACSAVEPEIADAFFTEINICRKIALYFYRYDSSWSATPVSSV